MSNITYLVDKSNAQSLEERLLAAMEPLANVRVAELICYADETQILVLEQTAANMLDAAGRLRVGRAKLENHLADRLCSALFGVRGNTQSEQNSAEVQAKWAGALKIIASDTAALILKESLPNVVDKLEPIKGQRNMGKVLQFPGTKNPAVSEDKPVVERASVYTEAFTKAARGLMAQDVLTMVRHPRLERDVFVQKFIDSLKEQVHLENPNYQVVGEFLKTELDKAMEKAAERFEQRDDHQSIREKWKTAVSYTIERAATAASRVKAITHIQKTLD